MLAFVATDPGRLGLITLAVLGDLRAPVRRHREERRWLGAIAAVTA